AGGQALGKALAGGLARLRAGLRRKKDGAPPPAADAVAPLPPVDENVVIGVSPTNNAPVEAPAAPGWDTVPTPPAALTDLDDILPTSDAAFSGADGDWPDTGSGPGGFTLSGDANLDGLTGLLGDDDFMAAAPEGNAAPDGGWMSAAAIRTWGRLVNAYKAVDRIVDFRKNWWLLVDGVAVVIMTVSFAVILGYFLYHR
ncbi:MAG: hypothetical protein J6333_06690, partial [Planctomycetes bacterium]|nr:hypothetical protein [Planctomycetota bacterium]